MGYMWEYKILKLISDEVNVVKGNRKFHFAHVAIPLHSILQILHMRLMLA